MADCIFCRVVAGELPSDVVGSSDLSYAFRDINPALPHHVLVVSREHIQSADTLQPDHGDLLADMMQLAQQVAESEDIKARGYRLVFNVGDEAQNSVPHLHLHVLGGRKMAWPPG
ncbi:MAG: histidine triad nucleotide-binding protein [Actinomycetota bacterium]|nr:histidine triad nucleotide-binding protein [Actinomycetota bacterium]